jgi:hypothetical protein
MKSRIIPLLGVVFGIVLSLTVAPGVRATNINMSTNECQDDGKGANNIGHGINGVYVVGSPALGWVTCNLPRAPLPTGATSGGFYVDGDNFEGGTAVCTISSFDYTGTFLGSASFSASEEHFDRLLSLPAAQLPFYAYTYLFCGLSSNGTSVLRGVTSLQ